METSIENVYIVGHTNPDLDSVSSAYGYQRYMQEQGYDNYIAIRCDDVNPLTEDVFKKYSTEIPNIVKDISGLNIVLVDHTYPENRANGWHSANILEVIDHHDVKLEDIIPKSITIRPCGATSTLIAEKFFNSNLNIDVNTAGILLCAILDDTLGLKSPTTEEIDMVVVDRLTKILGITDLEALTQWIFSKKDVWVTLSAKEIIEMDLKEVNFNNSSIAISQVESLDNGSLKEKEEEILEELERMNLINPFNLRIVMLTDVIKGECILLIIGEDINRLESVLGNEIVENRVYLPNVVSRKKQLLPLIEEIYSKGT